MQSNAFELSVAARNVEAKFYNKIGVVYVEGNDDKLFWAQYFNPKDFEIKKVDGCKNLADYEDEIINHGLRCIVAKDADYSAFMGKVNQHPLIVSTLSHSIECVMYCPHNVNACLKKLTRTFDDYLDEIQRSYDDFFADTKDIVAYDIANNVYGIGCSVCGDSCIPFMVSNQSIKVSADKRNDFILKIASHFTKEQIEKTRELLDNDKREPRQIVKGHFQTSFVTNLLKKLSSQITHDKAPSISGDVLYALLITCFSGCTEYCKERKVITQRVTNAIAALKA